MFSVKKKSPLDSSETISGNLEMNLNLDFIGVLINEKYNVKNSITNITETDTFDVYMFL